MYLGIDIGTSGVKVVVINDDNNVLEQAMAPLSISRPHPLWSEQLPDDWWAATTRAVTSLSQDRRSRIRSIGLSGQMHGAVLLDHAGKSLRPAILWNDGRSFEECTELEALEPAVREITANMVMPGFTAPKLLWVKTHEPDIFSQIGKVVLPKDYVRLCMTGDYASDMSDSAGSLWLNVAARDWSDEMLDATGLTRDHMPDLYEGSEVTGRLRQSVSEMWGVPPVPVVAGGGDNAAGAVGVGVLSPGEAFLSLGTSGVIFLAGDTCLPAPQNGVHAFCHALPDRWHQMSVMLSAASCLDWAARLTGHPDVPALVNAVEARDSLTGKEVFHPYLSGERTPHNNPQARGVFSGMDHDTDGVALGQSVLEGVAFAFADGLQALLSAGGMLSEISVIGGGARSDYWGRILSAALEMPLIYRRDGDVGPAFGAAKLARLGLKDADPVVVCAPPPILRTIQPSDRDINELADKKRRFGRLYQSLKHEFSGDI